MSVIVKLQFRLSDVVGFVVSCGEVVMGKVFIVVWFVFVVPFVSCQADASKAAQ